MAGHLSLPHTASCQELLNACVAHNGGAWDHSGLVRILEIMAGYEIGQKNGASEMLD
jgi:2-hydroxy-3-oxopropionate reductase